MKKLLFFLAGIAMPCMLISCQSSDANNKKMLLAKRDSIQILLKGLSRKVIDVQDDENILIKDIESAMNKAGGKLDSSTSHKVLRLQSLAKEEEGLQKLVRENKSKYTVVSDVIIDTYVR